MEKLSKFYEIRYWFGKKKKFIEELIFSALLRINKKTLKNDSFTKVLNLKNIHKNKRCFIVGNGPSLNKMELDLLKNDFCFIFNGAFSLRKKINKEKIFHVIEDRLVFADHLEAINKLDGKLFLTSDLQSKVISKNPIICHFQRSNSEKSKNWPRFVNCKKDSPIFYWGGTVAYFALQLAAWMGFKEIYIIGVDLSYVVPESTIKRGAVLESTEDDINHFEKDYFGKGKKWHIPNPERMLRAFNKSKESLKELDIKTYNAGIGGNLDCFERVKFEKLFDERLR